MSDIVERLRAIPACAGTRAVKLAVIIVVLIVLASCQMPLR
jgi:hypothetical protein